MCYPLKMLDALRVVIFYISIFSGLAEEATNKQYPTGDIKACLSDPLFKNTIRYEVLPGKGWDNLENKNLGLLVDYSYSQCKTTDDGKYLLPDSVETDPIKKSHIETYADIFEHWSDYTSMTSRSINIGGEMMSVDFSISGTFSYQSQNVKTRQVEDKSITTRVQARYVSYAARLQPDPPLNEVFKKRLQKIAGHIQVNKTKMAKYESQLLVRDFGTHVVTSVESGAIVGRLDEIKSTFAQNEEDSKSTILASASATFFDGGSLTNLGAKYSQVTNEVSIDQYLGNRTHSEFFSYGGPVYKPTNFSLDAWADDIGNGLIAVDRTGDPIYFLINRETLPQFSPSILYDLTEYVKDAVEQYYKFNVYRGCTDADSPNFSFVANVDDGTCESQFSNYSFGGVYQTCHQSGLPNRNLCSALEQKNPLTGDFSCPDAYEAILISDWYRTTRETRRSCIDLYFFKFDCTNYFVWGTAYFKSYWCVKQGSVEQQSGFEFGGLYTDSVPNLLTGRKNCPLYFFPLKMGGSLKICVSNDYELGFRYSVPFAGFFSCLTGNPLMANNRGSSHSHDLFAEYLKTKEHWPKGCPIGYSSHLAAIENGCEINYCVKAHAFSNHGLPPVRKPPYISLPSDAYIIPGVTYDVIITDDYNNWTEVRNFNATAGNSVATLQFSLSIIAGILVLADVLW